MDRHWLIRFKYCESSSIQATNIDATYIKSSTSYIHFD